MENPLTQLLVLSNAEAPDPVPALALLSHVVRQAPLQPAAIVDPPPCDVVVVDGRRDLVDARALCQLMKSTGAAPAPVLLLVTEGGLALVNGDWGFDDVVLESAAPVEVDARIRLLSHIGGVVPDARQGSGQIAVGNITIDEAAYTARVGDRLLDLTYKEFELLKFLTQHPGRVFSRAQLLQDVWGYDYFGGTRTVDVHVRRLRAKLGQENEYVIGTVRNVGYRLVIGADGHSPSDAD